MIARAYHRMGYQVVNIGSDDLSAGIEFLRELQREIHVPLISANLLDQQDGKPIFKSHMVLDLGGIRAGVFGLTSDVRHNKGVTPKGYVISNPITAAKRVVAELGKDCDIIVALSNQGSLKEYTKLVQQMEEIQFIFGSGGRGTYHQTIRSDRNWKAFLFRARTKGRYLGRIDLKVLKGSRDFVDLSRKANIEGQINMIEKQLDSYRRGTGRAKSIPRDKREEYIKKLEKFMNRSEARLSKLERDASLNSTFTNTIVPLDNKVKEDPEMIEWVDQFKRGQ
ncbi:MAG: hypothetical protein JSW70_10190 [Syntrophobacterales bacterium]|nr:MAG: hypothetical protein JSW70_10190 [Syntrophobacterales bacterium]